MRRLVLWDLDGTLLRAGGVSRDAFEAAVAAVLGRPVAAGSTVSYAGRTDPWIARAVLTAEGEDPGRAGEVLERYPAELHARRDRLAAQGRVLAGAHAALAGLAAAGARQGVVTGNLAVTARLKLTALAVGAQLDHGASAYGDDAPTREDLVPVALARAGGADPGVTWVVGDTPHDLSCARAGGVRCLLVATGPHGLAELSALGADAVLPDLASALEVLTPTGR